MIEVVDYTGKDKDFLVDVPVKTNIWIRPNCQKMQFEVIKNARPSLLFLQSDGGRNEKEQEIIAENRKLIENGIDWNCRLIKIYEETNHGLYEMGDISNECIWGMVDRCVFLEDDHIPSVSFFCFCAEMLKKYENDLRVFAICGMNHIGDYRKPEADYFFSRVGSIWGCACWKRSWEMFYDFAYEKSAYVMERVDEVARKDTVLRKTMRAHMAGQIYQNHPVGAEYMFSFCVYAQNQLLLLPRKNMIKCIGYEEGSTHFCGKEFLSKGAAQILDMQTYEFDFPLKETLYVIPDLYYEKKLKRIMAWHHPVISLYRELVHYVKLIQYGQFRYIGNKLKDKLFKKKEIEK